MLYNRNYPLGTHYFPDYIENNAIYVDKTRFIATLINNKNNRHFFLSRPRRFGKSLFVSTLEQVFLGKKELFKGLYIYDKIEWDTYPVIRLSMDKIGFTEAGLVQALLIAVKSIAQKEDITLTDDYPSICFLELITKLHEKYQKRVVILIDEYDKPIISYLEKTDTSQAEKNRDILKSFYGIMKDNGSHIHFTFVTGVSKFSQVSIFSDVNYLTDLTLSKRFATICGFTETEIKQYFQAGIEDLAQEENLSAEEILTKIRNWYDGFSWDGKNFVYNPYSTMLLMDNQEFDNYWFASGTPTFLVNLINPHHIYQFEDVIVHRDDYISHDLKSLDHISLMLQTGYLTFKADLGNSFYKANYPNKEVEKGFSKILLQGYMYKQPSKISTTLFDIEQAFIVHDLEKVIDILKDMFRILPSHFFETEKAEKETQEETKRISRAVGESFYHAIIYLIFNILGIRMHAEVTSQEGRIDAYVETDTHIYLFEFKRVAKATSALSQIKANKYTDLFALSKKLIYLIGVSFSPEARGISDHKIEMWQKPIQ